MGKKTSIKIIGKQIKEAREKKQISITNLAWQLKKYKVTEEDIVNWEKGKNFPNLEMMYQLSYILDLNPNNLLKHRNNIQQESYAAPNVSLRNIIGLFFNYAKPIYFNFIKNNYRSKRYIFSYEFSKIFDKNRWTK